MSVRPLLVTVDVECDKGPDWRTQSPLAFAGVALGIGQRLHPLCTSLGLRPTYLLSPEVLCDVPSVALLRALPHCELGSHLHGEYVAPFLPSLQFAGVRTDDMQWEYDSAVEFEKLATLTELFRQQIGCAPRSFRAGRFGIGPHSGAHLLALGYRCDSSVTPLVQWTSQTGVRLPDFRDARQDSWFVADSGDLLTAGDSTLFEIPVTIRNSDDGPRWLRPWYSSREQLIALIDQVANEPGAPLCMMFHNVELIAAGSPYPQSEADVQRYLDDFQAAMAHALQLGFTPMTMAEAQTHALQQRVAQTSPQHAVLPSNPSPRDRTVRLPAAEVLAATERSGTQAWHSYAHQQRAQRWDLTEPYSWLAGHLAPDAAVLDVGCGVASNLIYLAEQGLHNLSGFDLDQKAIAAASDLLAHHNLPVRVWVDDGMHPEAIPATTFAAITAVNWTYLVEAFSLDAFLSLYAPRLQAGGYLVIDAIDQSFAQHPNHQWRTSDWLQPMPQRRPSEYRHRFQRSDLVQAAASHGLDVVCEFRRDDEIPKAVYVLQRPKPKQVLFVVDAPGWAHDHKSRNLSQCLPTRYRGRIVYQQDLVTNDLDDSDLIVIWYWRQLESIGGLGEALARNRHKLLMGVCSHNELEGELAAPGLSILRRLPAAVFTHSALLEHEVRDLLPESTPYCLPNGVDAYFFRPGREPNAPPTCNARPLRVGWAGSLDNFGADMRGVSTMLQPAIARLNAEYPGAFELRLAAREDRMRSPAEMRAFYQDLDVYVCASRVEGTPNPCLEAAACGIPVVSTRVGNMPELIQHGHNGLLIDRSANALAAALLYLQQAPEQRARMGQQLRQTIVAEWTWSKRSHGFVQLFDAILTANNPVATDDLLEVGSCRS